MKLSLYLIVPIILIGCSNKNGQSGLNQDLDELRINMRVHDQQRSSYLTEKDIELYDNIRSYFWRGKFDSVKYLIEKHDIDLSRFHDQKGYTSMLSGAASKGNREMFVYLLERGAKLDLMISNKRTILHDAAYGGDLAIVKFLVEKGVEAYHTGYWDYQPIHAAADGGHYDVFIYLVREYPYFYDWPNVLTHAINGGNLDIVKYLVEMKGVNLNRKPRTYSSYPIELAADNKYGFHDRGAEIVKYLVSRGANPYKINEGKVISWALEHSDDATIEFFLKLGVPVDLKQDGEWTPLAMALDENSFALARYFIKRTRNHTFRDTPLVIHFADGKSDSHEIIDFLVKEGVNKEYYTDALWQCAFYGDSASTHLLLDAGADARHMELFDSVCILHYANNYSVAALLIEYGADIHDPVMLTHAWKNPPLLHALENIGVYPPASQQNLNIALGDVAQLGDLQTVQYLLKRGADVNAQLPIIETEGEKAGRLRNESFLDEDNERYDLCIDAFEAYFPAENQTPLIKNAIQGYINGYDWHNKLYEGDRELVLFDVAEILLKAGADPDIADSRGKTALHYAAGNQDCRSAFLSNNFGRYATEKGSHVDPVPPPNQYHDHIARLLIEYGANLNIQDRKGDTPLILAAKSKNSHMLKMLLDAKANHRIRNKKGKTLFDYLDGDFSIQVIREAGLSGYLKKR